MIGKKMIVWLKEEKGKGAGEARFALMIRKDDMKQIDKLLL